MYLRPPFTVLGIINMSKKIILRKKISPGDLDTWSGVMEQRGSILSSSTCAFICERIALNMLYPAFRTCMAHSHLDQNRWNFEVTFFHIERYGQSIELRKVDRPIIKPFFRFSSSQWHFLLNYQKETQINNVVYKILFLTGLF